MSSKDFPSLPGTEEFSYDSHNLSETAVNVNQQLPIGPVNYKTKLLSKKCMKPFIGHGDQTSNNISSSNNQMTSQSNIKSDAKNNGNIESSTVDQTLSGFIGMLLKIFNI